MDPAIAEHCRAIVYRHDRDNYLASLFAPEKHRAALWALYAFDVEIRRIPGIVNDPMAGEIRLQWWSDAIRAVEHGSIEGHPVAAALHGAIAAYNLPRQPLIDLVEAHVFDLYNDPMPALADLEGYAGETSSALLQLAAIVLADGGDPGTADCSGHAGVALAIARLLRTLPRDFARGRMFLPADVLARHGLSAEDALERRDIARLGAVIADMAGHARHHLARFSEAFDPKRHGSVAAAYLQTGIVPLLLERLEKTGADPDKAAPDVPQWRRQWRLWITARRLSG